MTSGNEKGKYVIIAYQELGNDRDKHIFHADNKRQVVGLMKTINKE